MEPAGPHRSERSQDLNLADDVADFVAGLPKAELHIHLEGSLEPDMLFAFAARNDVDIPWQSPQQLQAAYRFDNLGSFLDLYYQGTRVLVCEQDFYELTYSYLTRAHADSVVRAEMFIGPQSFLERGVALSEVMTGALAAIDAAVRDMGISAGLLVIAQRHRSVEDALDLLRAIEPWADRIAGLGLGGAERDNPPTKFSRFFDEARRRGFRRTAHAGEEGPASFVRDALDVLGVDRIDHGVACMNDPALVEELAARNIPLTVCPVSNDKLQVVSSVSSHPLPAMLAAGLRVSVNSDDPAYFGAYVNDCLRRCHSLMHLTLDDVIELARNSLLSSFAAPSDITRWLQRLDDYCDGAPKR